MPHDEMQDVGQSPPSDSPPSPSQEEYTITIIVSQDGFEVDGELVADLPTALKHIISIVKEHPLSGDANAEMKAGYESA